MSLRHPVLLLSLLLLCLILQNATANAKPYDMWSGYQSLIPKTETDCDVVDEIETLCQKCAKQTKSSVVYPMCCQNREEAREWCQKYMSFGLQ
ncbi:hypothetical protein RUM43_009255 [Polyplax serrata]